MHKLQGWIKNVMSWVPDSVSQCGGQGGGGGHARPENVENVDCEIQHFHHFQFVIKGGCNALNCPFIL